MTARKSLSVREIRAQIVLGMALKNPEVTSVERLADLFPTWKVEIFSQAVADNVDAGCLTEAADGVLCVRPTPAP